MGVGKGIERIDVLQKVLGNCLFAGDIRMEGMIFGVVVRSNRPHPKILEIDDKAAWEVPGLVKIITHKEIPGRNRFGVLRKDQPYLAEGYVRYLGEPILLVVAQDERSARRAAKRIKVVYQDLPIISDPQEARMGTPLHDGGNLLTQKRLIKGNWDKGFEDSDVIVEHHYVTHFLDHAFLECEAGVGYMEEEGQIVIISSTQNIHYKQKEVAALLNMPESKIRVIQATTGGGFGGKLDVTVEGYVALGVFHTKRPVMVRYTREESMLSNTKRHPLSIWYKSGAKRDGALTRVQVRIVGDTGACLLWRGGGPEGLSPCNRSI